MHKKLIFIFCISTQIFLISSEIPQFFDFGQLFVSSSHWSNDISYSAPFNNCPEIGIFIVYLKKRYNINTAIETGTYKGHTSMFLSYLFNSVHTTEINQSEYNDTYKILKNCSNITCHLGSSDKVFQHLLPSLKGERLFFYLDAHWNDFWPLLDEIREIGKTHFNNCIIMIDDFKVPNRPDIEFDKYGNHECSMEYIQNELNKVYSSYSYHFLIPFNKERRAKLLIIPTNWK